MWESLEEGFDRDVLVLRCHISPKESYLLVPRVVGSEIEIEAWQREGVAKGPAEGQLVKMEEKQLVQLAEEGTY
jgi:hypothetical protein